jgi:hypothetical protein
MTLQIMAGTAHRARRCRRDGAVHRAGVDGGEAVPGWGASAHHVEVLLGRGVASEIVVVATMGYSRMRR